LLNEKKELSVLEVKLSRKQKKYKINWGKPSQKEAVRVEWESKVNTTI